MERIMIIGCGGAGKSTLATKLGEKTGLPVVHLDKLYWKPGWVNRSREEFDVIHRNAINKERWIIDGNFDRTMELRMQHCDTVLYLDFSRIACLIGVIKRIIMTYGMVRPDMGEGCPERFDWEFLKWVWNFKKNKRENHYILLEKYNDKKIIILKNRRAVKRFLNSL